MSGPYFCDDFGAVYLMDSRGCWRFDGIELNGENGAGGYFFRQIWTDVDAIPHHDVEIDAGLVANMMHRFELDALRPRGQAATGECTMKIYWSPRKTSDGDPGGYTVSKSPKMPKGDFGITEYIWPHGQVLWFVDKDKFTADEREAARMAIYESLGAATGDA